MIRALCLLFSLILIFAARTSTAFCQKTDVDLKAYRDYLSSHQNLSAGGLMAEHPAPVFQRRVGQPVSGARYLDSVIAKYQLTKDEIALFGANGFVVTERLTGDSFGELLDGIWQNDLPVFISTDAILHAVHMSYDEILKTTEVKLFIPTLGQLLGEMHTRGMASLHAAYGKNPAMKPMLQDIDVYLTVARRLLLDQRVPAYDPADEAAVGTLMQMIADEQPADFPLFSGTNRTIDFSQFTVRGHYTQDPPVLGRYFQSMIWLGRTEFMLTKPKDDGPNQQTDEDIQRQIVDAYLLLEMLQNGSNMNLLKTIDDLIVFLVGESDNVQAGQLDMLRQETGFTTADQLLDKGTVDLFKANLATKPYADQRINSQILMSDPMSPEQLKPPSAFLLLGQRFIIDSYVFGNVVYDRIISNGQKVRRMLPSSMDVLFAIGNDAAAQLLQDELARYSYAPNLGALRFLVDSYGDDFWNASLYNTWLHSIRALNAPDDLESYPEFMRTAAWWQQKMNTQLSSWAQLRHDNLLYGKQSYTGGTTCSYPEGYVEPFPEMYARLKQFAERASGRYAAIDGFDAVAQYFTRLGAVMDTLRIISGKELNGVKLEAREVAFMQSMLSTVPICGKMYNGWYTRLFYAKEVTDEDYIIADVHTAPTDEAGNMVGWVKHVSTGRLNLGFVAAPSQLGGTTVYTGPMLSYHEHVTTNFKRLTDEEWKTSLKKTEYPRPDWTNVYLADARGTMRIPGPMLISSPVSVDPATPPAAAMPVLHAAYPNPFSADQGTLIGFSLPSRSSLTSTLEIFDVNGRKMCSLVNEPLDGGLYYTRWDGRDSNGRDVPSGMYFIKLSQGAFATSQSLVLVR